MSVEITYKPELPVTKQPIIIIGAGGIVADAHLPAYKLANFTVHGIVNRTKARAEKLATAFDIPHVYDTVAEAVKLDTKEGHNNREWARREIWNDLMPPSFDSFQFRAKLPQNQSRPMSYPSKTENID